MPHALSAFKYTQQKQNSSRINTTAAAGTKISYVQQKSIEFRWESVNTSSIMGDYAALICPWLAGKQSIMRAL